MPSLAIVGDGEIADRHRDAFRRVPGVELVATATPESVRDLLSRSEIETIDVCAPSAQQVEIGSANWDSVALTAAATVVSRHGSSVVLDAGGKVLGADRAAWATGNGRLPDHPEARVTATVVMCSFPVVG